MHDVAFKRSISYDTGEVDAAVRAAVGLLGGMERYVKPGMEVLIKPNMLMARTPARAVTTHPEVVRAVVRLVKEAGGRPSVGDSQAIGSFKKICEVTGIGAVAREEGARLVELSEAVEVDGRGTFRKLELSRAAVEADAVINLPKAKTHAQMLLTLAVKNMFGCVPGKRKPQWHFRCGVDRHAFAEMLVEVCRTVGPVLNVADAVVGMEGNGPGSGRPVGIDYIVASADAFALDLALAGIMGVDGDRLPTTRAARRLGLIPEGRDWVVPLGDIVSLDGARMAGFRLPSASNLEWSIPEPMRRFLKDALTTRPRVDADRCGLCGMCVGTCPARAMNDSSGEVRIDLRRCIRCYCCQEICPEGAIGVREGWLLRVMR